jgi:hypothetical protein
MLYEGRIANWATLGEMIDLLIARTPLDDGFHYLWYYFARPLDEHPVADTQIFSLNVSFVV